MTKTTNKKLIDRGTRLIAKQTGLSYAEACTALHRTMAELAGWNHKDGARPSPVALTIERLGPGSKGNAHGAGK